MLLLNIWKDDDLKPFDPYYLEISCHSHVPTCILKSFIDPYWSHHPRYVIKMSVMILVLWFTVKMMHELMSFLQVPSSPERQGNPWTPLVCCCCCWFWLVDSARFDGHHFFLKTFVCRSATTPNTTPEPVFQLARGLFGWIACRQSTEKCFFLNICSFMPLLNCVPRPVNDMFHKGQRWRHCIPVMPVDQRQGYDHLGGRCIDSCRSKYWTFRLAILRVTHY